MNTMQLQGLVRSLEDRIQSVEEETYELFAQELPSQNLGFVDSKSTVVELTVARHDLTIHQSPAVLSSNRAGGTTGAVLWKITPVFADWISRPDNILFANGMLSSDSTVIELGCGISAVVGLLLAPKISRYILSDQSYVARLVEQNIDENIDILKSSASTGKGTKGSRKARSSVGSSSSTANLLFRPVDWETDEVTSSLTGSEATRSFDAVLACDCIYNDTLIEPLVQTCVDICKLRAEDTEKEACLCIVAQQLRDPDIFEAWLGRFMRDFDVWRVPDSHVVDGLQSNSGFVVHLGVLKGWEGAA